MTEEYEANDSPFVSRIEVANIPPFTEPVELNLSPKINVFIGSNSTGKTTILKLLKSLGPSHRFAFLGRARREGSFKAYLESNDKESLVVDEIKDIPLIWIPANRIPLLHDAIIPENFARAVNHVELSEVLQLDDRSDSVAALIASEVSKMVNAYFEEGDPNLIEKAYEVGERVLDCLKEICKGPQIVTAEFPYHFVDYTYIDPKEGSRIRRSTIPFFRIHYLMGLDVVDDPNSRIYA